LDNSQRILRVRIRDQLGDMAVTICGSIVGFRSGLEMGPMQMFIMKRLLCILTVAFCSWITPTIESRSYSQDSFDTVIEVTGKLKAARGNTLTITRDDDIDVTVKLHEDPTKMLFSAIAKPQWIRVGMLVRVEATFGPNGQAVQPVDKVELFQAFQAAKLPPSARVKYLPGAYSLTETQPDAQGKTAGFQPGNYRIVGPIIGMGPEGIIVNAGPVRVPLPIAAEANWLIRNHDLSLATPGDIVKVTGFHQPPDETKIIASDVRVTVDRVYGEAGENDRTRKRTRRSTTATAKQDAPTAEVASPDIPNPAP